MPVLVLELDDEVLLELVLVLELDDEVLLELDDELSELDELEDVSVLELELEDVALLEDVSVEVEELLVESEVEPPPLEDELESVPVEVPELDVELVPDPEVDALVELAVLVVLGEAQRQAWKPLPSDLHTWPPSQPPTPTQATDWPGMQSAALVPDVPVELGADPEQPAATTANTHRTLRMTPPEPAALPGNPPPPQFAADSAPRP